MTRTEVDKHHNQSYWDAAKNRLLTVREVADWLQTSTRTVWRLVSASNLPQPLRLSKRTVRWRISDIRKWIESGCPKDWQRKRIVPGVWRSRKEVQR